jgi:hypothetical protein
LLLWFFFQAVVLLLLAVLMVAEWQWFQRVRHGSSSSPCRGAGCCLFFNDAATCGEKMVS